MASKASSSASASASKSQASSGQKITGGKAGTGNSREILTLIDSIKKQITADRFSSIKEKIEANRQKLSTFTQHTYNLSKLRRNNALNSIDADSNMLTRKQHDAMCAKNDYELPTGERDGTSFLEECSSASSSMLLGGNLGGKSSIRPIKLPEVTKLPPYTTWIFLDRNQRMSDDQSVLGRRRIYYDPNSDGEALICSDSEDELVDDEEEKKEFKHNDDYILRKTIQETGLTDTALDVLAKCLGRTTDEIKARYEVLPGKKTDDYVKKQVELAPKVEEAVLEKDLDAALDSFDNLFCRRCLVFDCRLHGCSQDMVFPVEKQQPWNNQGDDLPCGPHCYKLAPKSEFTSNVHEEIIQSPGSGKKQKATKKKSQTSSLTRKSKTQQSESSSNAKVISESSESEVPPPENSNGSSAPPTDHNSGAKKGNKKRAAERVLACIRKRQKEAAESGSNSIYSGSRLSRGDAKDTNGDKDSLSRTSKKKKMNQKGTTYSESSDVYKESFGDGEISKKEEVVGENVCKQAENKDVSWKPIEQGLFIKGLDIFGRNCCLIARNLLNGMKTCLEVFQYMTFVESNSGDGAHCSANNLVRGHLKGIERARSRYVRRRGRVRRLKYTWKSAGYHSIRKRITEKKDQPCRQYNPCGCQTSCGKQCPCLVNGTCCEKYCGCPKMCKNRFRGCHCAKSQCRSRQCPCFAADRECDPDVCRNCWVSCGDGTLGVPNQRGDNYECRNMKLLLKQQQRVLLGKSDVSGWGAFLKNSVGKHEYLGEYTGELISHREADKRGKIYDRENSSFLFNLNDQFVLDAYRMGDKLKFANHSPDPNCYAKVIMVAGDHRVGIFAKERISAGEELFYDYRYEPDRAPAWARKPEALGSKDDINPPSTGRAKKLA
ncbi:SET domain-containing protein isoform X2 [Carex rostrata]